MATVANGLISKLTANISTVVLGKPDAVRLCVMALLTGDHILLEDVPGVGKTLLAKALAKSVEGEFSRIQFTPDLLPSDIIGSSIFRAQTGEFTFHRGPIFANIVLADEVNRTTPRTQSALLEAMSEGQISADGQTYQLPRPFLVIATQNPFEFEGTYPLLESQLDRFLFRSKLGYAEREHEKQMFHSHRSGEPVDQLKPALNAEQISQLQQIVRNIKVDESIEDYLLSIVEATRETDQLLVGVSTRAALSLYRAAQALALIEDRDYVVPDDIKYLAVPVFSHRIIAKGYHHGVQSQAMEEIMRRLVEKIPVP